LIDPFVLELDRQLGISEGRFKTHLDGSYYVYVPICNYEVTPRRILDTREKRDQSPPMVDLNIVITAQGGRNLRVWIEPTATVWDLKEEISRLTGIAMQDQSLMQDGRPIENGTLEKTRLHPVVLLVTRTGGAGSNKTSKSQHDSASRGTRSQLSSGGPRTKKRARNIQSSRRAAKFRANTLKSKLSHEDTLEIMDRRENPNEEVLEREVDELVDSMEEDPKSARAFAAQETFRQSLARKKVPRYGNLDPRHKQDESVRLMSLNINGLSMSKSVNPKADRLKQIIPKYSIDMVGMQETCINWTEFKPSHTIASLLRATEDPMRSVHSFNRHETKDVGRVQRGGTATIANDVLSNYVKSSGADHTQLGRWSWSLLEGEPGHKTRVITAYAPCGSEASGLATNWKQQKRYIQTHRINTRDPRQMFENDLYAALLQWREQGDRLILMMDANSNAFSGKFTRRLAADELQMREAVHSVASGQGPHTHIRGSEPIDGIWFSNDLELQGACYLPFDGSLGDHRPVVADFSHSSVLGLNLPRIVPSKARRLNSKVPRIRDKYIEILEGKVKEGGILNRLRKIDEDSSFPASTETTAALEKIDRQLESMMLSAEKSCRKKYAAHYEFSPTVQFWINRCQVYRALIKLREKMDTAGTCDPKHPMLKRQNIRNIYRRAERSGIIAAKKLTLRELMMQYGACRSQTKSLLSESPWMRQQFLAHKLDEAKRQEKDEEAKRVNSILRKERQKRTWSSLQRVVKPDKAGAVAFVDVQQEDGTTKRCDTKESVEGAIADEILPRFSRAANAPICQGALFNLLGYGANTETAIEILEGRFEPPEGTDGPTLLLFEEIARIWSLMEAGEVDIVVTKDDFQHFWKRMNERTASSYSKLHIGHYKSAAHSEVLSEIHAKKLSLITQTGSAPERWARGLSVMLEKIAGVALVTKLRAIILMEADFNFHNKLIFGKRMLDLARKHNLVPDEIYSEKGKTAEDAILHQVLAYDIARQKRAPFIVASVDASQCYDRISHAMAALTLRASKVPASSVHCMLQPIRDMEFYVRTAFGESKDYVGGKEVTKQGGGQGNGAAPPTWQQIGTTMIRAQHKAGHGVFVESPISKKSCSKAGILYVDDTNLWAGLTRDDDLLQTAAKAQDSINSWGELLKATGGSLNPKKCFWTIHDMAPRSDGTWEYRQCTPALSTIEEGNEMPGTDLEDREDDRDQELDDIKMTIPQQNGDAAAIAQLQSSQATVNLGLLAPPDGSATPQFDAMRNRVDTWTAQIKGGHLPARSNWLSYQCQLWPGLKYGLGVSAATMDELGKCLRSRDHKILSTLGICRNIPTELRYIPSQYGGFALKSLSSEATAEALNMFLQHYGTDSTLGVYLTATLENLQLELGVTGCPLTYDYSIWEHLATDSWIKSVWERIFHFGIDLQLGYTVLAMPRVNDESIMETCVDEGIRGAELISINRARKRQEALFMSDIVTADGTKIDATYLSDWTESAEFELGKHRSQFEFGREAPTTSDWQTWNNYWNRFCNGSPFLTLPSQLGGWRAPSPRIWRTFYDEEEARLEVLSDTLGVISFREVNRRFVRTSSDLTATPKGATATVEWLSADSIKLKHYAGSQINEPDESVATDFSNHLRSWGGEWMWKDLRMDDAPAWVADSLRKGTIVCVTDGSYNRKIDPGVCSAGWIIMCRETKRRVVGTVLERSEAAGSYRGELLGMLAIRLFLLAVEEFYQVDSTDNSICCDNLGALFTFGKKSKRVPKGRSNSDIHRVIRTINGRTSSKYLQQHVKAHQDDHTLLSRLSFEAQLNCVCDTLAKSALHEYWTGLNTEERERIQAEPSLPLETARVYVDGTKQTTDVNKGLTQGIGAKQARAYWARKSGQGIPPDVFDLIDFPAIELALKGKPQMYKVWYAKQVTGWCATGAKLAQWDANADSRCPNCNMLHEDAAHLLRCRDAGRVELFKQSIQALGEWMKTHGTQPTVARLVILYLKGRGVRKLASATNLPEQFVSLCVEQDQIGWRNFTEGRISKQFRTIQAQYLRVHHPRRSVDSWMKGFVGQLLHLTHSQWIYRCITKHHRTKGTKAIARREALEQEVHRQRQLGEDAMAEEDKWMLEIDLEGSSTEGYQYWLYAVEAARQAGAHALEVSNGATASWSDVVKSGSILIDPPRTCPAVPLTPAGTTATTTQQAKSTTREATAPQRTGASRKKSAHARSITASVPNIAKRYKRAGGFPSRRKNVCSDYAKLVDDSNILEEFSKLPRQSRRQVKMSFAHKRELRVKKSTILGRRTSTEDVEVYRYRGHSMTQADFNRLESTQWLSDANINMFLQAYVTDKIDRAQCFSSHFFTQLFSRASADHSNDKDSDNVITEPSPAGDRVAPSDEDSFNYHEVRNYSNQFDGFMSDEEFTLDNLLIPAHVDGNHWIVLRVKFADQLIEVYDSMGTVNPTYNRHLEALRRYLYHDLHKHLPEHSWPPYGAWSRNWRMRNASRLSPRQLNGYDCGVFTMISSYLLARGVQLARDTYDQEYVDSNNLRHNLALALLNINELPDPVSGQPRLQFQPPTSNPSRRKRKRSKRGAVGSKRPRTNLNRIEDHAPSHDTPLLNRKRTAKSLTDTDPSQRSLTDLWTNTRPPKKKKKKGKV